MREQLDSMWRQAAVLDETAHRPWPPPDAPWAMGQSWLDLAFLHWPVDADALRSELPDGLSLDLFDGRAWLGITPFSLEGLRLRGLPPLPYLSSFLEANVRTYVTAGGKPGIWFFSLDASRRGAVEAARLTYRLPYFHAEMHCARRGGGFEFTSERLDGRGRSAALSATYEPAGEPAETQPGSLEHFLTERYCLYASHDGTLLRAEIHHPPWPLQPAEARVDAGSLPPRGVRLEAEPLAHFSARQDVVVWRPQPV